MTGTAVHPQRWWKWYYVDDTHTVLLKEESGTGI